MAALLWLHLWHCVSEGSSFSAGWGCVHSHEVTDRGVWDVEVASENSPMEKKRTFKTCWWVGFKKRRKKPQNNPEQPGFTVAVWHPTVWDLWPPKGRIIIHATKKNPTSPKISFEGAALPATYIPSECFSLLHLSARLIWRTLFSRRLWPCLYFDIRRQRKPLCPLFRFHLCAFAVDLRVVLARRSMEYLLARGLLGESVAYQLGL